MWKAIKIIVLYSFIFNVFGQYDFEENYDGDDIEYLRIPDITKYQLNVERINNKADLPSPPRHFLEKLNGPVDKYSNSNDYDIFNMLRRLIKDNIISSDPFKKANIEKRNITRSGEDEVFKKRRSKKRVKMSKKSKNRRKLIVKKDSKKKKAKRNHNNQKAMSKRLQRKRKHRKNGHGKKLKKKMQRRSFLHNPHRLRRPKKQKIFLPVYEYTN